MTGSLYFHIPFCKKKCPYCHFFVVQTKDSLVAQYQEAVKQEWVIKQKYISSFKEITSVYFGGGTPSQLPTYYIKELLDLIKKECFLSPNVEITIEVNPEDATNELFQQYLSFGINRLSIGVQSLHKPLLQEIGRNHSSEQCSFAITTAFNAGFRNISIDLMYDLPHQKVEDFQQTINAVNLFPITHLSLYNLVIEPGTVFEKKKKLLQPHLPSEVDSFSMLDYAVHQLESFGFKRYEISAFAKNGLLSVHNTGYWQGRSFIGLGPSAFSFINGQRFQNHSNLKRYFESVEKNIDPIGFEETLPFPKSLQEQIAIRLRMLEGFSLSEYQNIPSHMMNEFYRLRDDGFILMDHHHLQLTEKGVNFYDTVASALV